MLTALLFSAELCIVLGLVDGPIKMSERRILEESERLFARLRTPRLKEAARNHARALTSDPISRDRIQALGFFCDIRAREVLCAALQSKDTYLRGQVAASCLDGLTAQELVELYKASLDSDAFAAGGGETRQKSYVHSLSICACRILGSVPSVPKSCEPEAVRQWWTELSRTARATSSFESGCDKALRRLSALKDSKSAIYAKLDITSAVSAMLKNYVREANLGDQKDLLVLYGKLLLSKDTKRAQEALDFFCDVRANQLLLTFLSHGEWSMSEYVATSCLDCFGDDDLPALLDAVVVVARRVQDDPIAAGPAGDSIVTKIASKACKLLGQTASVPKVRSVIGVFEWWREATEAARRVGSCRSALDDLIDQVGRKSS